MRPGNSIARGEHSAEFTGQDESSCRKRGGVDRAGRRYGPRRPVCSVGRRIKIIPGDNPNAIAVGNAMKAGARSWPNLRPGGAVGRGEDCRIGGIAARCFSRDYKPSVRVCRSAPVVHAEVPIALRPCVRVGRSENGAAKAARGNVGAVSKGDGVKPRIGRAGNYRVGTPRHAVGGSNGLAAPADGHEAVATERDGAEIVGGRRNGRGPLAVCRWGEDRAALADGNEVAKCEANSKKMLWLMGDWISPIHAIL